MKATSTAIVVLGLSLLAWSFFYLSGLPLGAAETTVVVGLIGLVVICVNRAVRRIRKRRESEQQ